MTCTNCREETTAQYCSRCGGPVSLERIGNRYLLSELSATFFLEKGFFYTVRELVVRPGQSVGNFLLKDRRRLMKPVIFIILTSLIYTVINHYFPFEEKYVTESEHNSHVNNIRRRVSENYGYSNLIVAVFIAGWIIVFFRMHGYYCIEILILLCYAMGMGMLVLAVFGFLENVTGSGFMTFAGVLSFLYPAWAIGNFFQNSFKSYVVAFAAYIAGVITFMIAVFSLGLMLDTILAAS